MMASRDEILAIFQASTGLDDIATSIDILEQYDWVLELAVNSVLPQAFPGSAPAQPSLDERPVSSENSYIDLTSSPTNRSHDCNSPWQPYVSGRGEVTPRQPEVSGHGQYSSRQPEVVVSSSDDETFDDAKETLSDEPDEDSDGGGVLVEDDMFVDDRDMDNTSIREPLIPGDCSEPVEALSYFSARFTQRYGPIHPLFYIGDLTDAVKVATGGSADERKPMLIYLHHDKSILSNIFCSTLLCCESIVNYLSSNYVVWAWDLTMESLKRKLLDMVKECFGLAVAKNVDDIKPDHLPVILIVYKSKGQVEVRNIIQGHIDASTMMSHLMDAIEQHSLCCQYDLKEELERKAREDMKLAQEQAFEESLLADRQKMRLREAEEEEQRQRVLEEQLQVMRKEEKRLILEQTIPDEPPLSSTESVSTLRIRLPDGTTVQRRFLASLSVKILVSYVGSLGYPAEDYRVLSSYPRRDVTELDCSLAEAKLFPKETLFVEER